MTSKKREQILERQAFLARRMEGIGGSDVHHLFSLKPWGCVRKLAYEKLELVTGESQSRAMMRGTKLEAVAADFYQEETGRKIRRMPHRVRKDKPHLMVHADREIHSKHCPFQDLSGPGILEIKVPARWAFNQITEAGLPEAYQLQMQHALLVTGRKWGSFCILWADGWILKWWDVQKDPAICDAIEAKADSFWQCLEEGPGILEQLDFLPAGDPRCKRCHHREYCHDAHLSELKEQPQDTDVVDNSEDLVTLVEEYQVRSRMLKDAEELKKQSEKQLKEYMGEQKQLQTDGSKIYFKPQERKVLDKGKLKKQWPDVYEKCMTTSWSRPLRIYQKKG